ncbi:MAG TPA: beta-ketoacyl-[acyl-carrier-protein] synthase family protein [Acidimicrobiia bacterium]
MDKKRVVVTGIGAVAAPGIGIDDIWKGLHTGPTHDGPKLIENWNPDPIVPLRESRRLDRFTQFALVAADEAFQQAGDFVDDPNRVTVSIATGIGGLESLEHLVNESQKEEPRVSPFQIPMMMANAAAAAISIKYGFGGMASTPVVACAAGSQSILDGMRQVQWGYADVAVVGGTEAAARNSAREGFAAARALSKSGIARPFDLDRDGFVMGEGGAVLVLEELERARARGATILAEVLGGASTADAYHITAPHPKGDGAERAMRLAIDDAGIDLADVGYINAHGTGTELNDRTEGVVVDRIFGNEQPAISSIKGTTGHGLGASGSIEAAIVIESIIRGELLPNIGMENQDPAIPLNDIVEETRSWDPKPTLSNSFGFGGHNTVPAFGPY